MSMHRIDTGEYGMDTKREYGMDTGECAADSDRRIAEEFVEFLVVANGELNVTGNDTPRRDFERLM